MIPIIYGEIFKKVVVLVGDWELLLPLHYSLIQAANKYCIDNDFELLLVMFPPGSSKGDNKSTVPKFHCTEANIRLLNKKFYGAVCKPIMDECDQESNIVAFLSVIRKHFDIAELWLINGQELGSEMTESFATIDRTCDEENIRLNILSINEDLKKLTSLVRKHLSEGNIRMATEIVGQAPIWMKQKDISIPIGWKPGIYKYYPLLFVADKFTLNGRYSEIEIFSKPGGYSSFKWPDDKLDLIAITD